PLQQFLIQERLDIRGAGAGKDPLDARRAGTEAPTNEPAAKDAAETETK
nr:hypothetical protein [Planctomycetota bacterium]